MLACAAAHRSTSLTTSDARRSSRPRVFLACGYGERPSSHLCSAMLNARLRISAFRRRRSWKSASRLRYSKVVPATNADADGIHVYNREALLGRAAWRLVAEAE